MIGWAAEAHAEGVSDLPFPCRQLIESVSSPLASAQERAQIIRRLVEGLPQATDIEVQQALLVVYRLLKQAAPNDHDLLLPAIILLLSTVAKGAANDEAYYFGAR